MPKKSLKGNQYAEPGYVLITESAANTLTFKEIAIAKALDNYQAMVMHRLEYVITPASMAELIAAADYLQVGMTLSSNVTALGIGQVEVFDRIIVTYQGSAGTNMFHQNPLIHDLSSLPSGGLIVPVKRLYGAIKGTSLANPCEAEIRFWYTILEASEGEYLQMLQALDILT